ncbi:unnamed protein product [Nesidiocoris tenuis]|uniref:Uncharacterized protein n=1 Tax=Nesidiocoris tenuis TaxID=355587 RepID=A0A6H5GB76_9HEMI|nr:unnamed protein product [Nesidiocoris tenuis]
MLMHQSGKHIHKYVGGDRKGRKCETSILHLKDVNYVKPIGTGYLLGKVTRHLNHRTVKSIKLQKTILENIKCFQHRLLMNEVFCSEVLEELNFQPIAPIFSGPIGPIPKQRATLNRRNPRRLRQRLSFSDLRVAEPTTYESEDETMGRRKQTGRLKRGTPTYSKQDIREQYCINDRQLLGLEDTTSGLFGCLSSYQDSSCSSRSPSLLTVCVRRRIPSDENLAELVRRPMAEYAPFPRWMPPYPPPLHAYPSPAGHPMKAYYHDHYPPFYPDDDEPCRMVRTVFSV